MTAPDLNELEALLAKATPGPWWYDFKGGSGAAIIRSDTVRTVLHCGTVYPQDARLIVAAVNALPELVAYVRELERERQRKPKRDLGGSTHWDIAEVGTVCHDECAVAQIKAAAEAMRERCAQACEALKVNRPSDPLANAFDGACETCAAAVRALEP